MPKLTVATQGERVVFLPGRASIDRDRCVIETTTNSDTVDDIALLGFVSKSTCLVRMRWMLSTVYDKRSINDIPRDPST